MLVLSRKAGESIMIGDRVEVVILGGYGNNTRVGINAPLEIAVHRMEIYQKIKNQEKAKQGLISQKKAENNEWRDDK